MKNLLTTLKTKAKELLNFTTVRAILLILGIGLVVLTGDGSWSNAGFTVYLGMTLFVAGLGLPWLVKLIK